MNLPKTLTLGARKELVSLMVAKYFCEATVAGESLKAVLVKFRDLTSMALKKFFIKYCIWLFVHLKLWSLDQVLLKVYYD